MNLVDCIINDVHPLTTQAKIVEAKRIFKKLTYSHLPVFKEGNYVGCISENDAHCMDGETSLMNNQYILEPFFVKSTTNWLDVLTAFAKQSTNIMPVIDNGNYLGYYELKDVLAVFDNTPFLHQPGSILIIEKLTVDYSMSEVVQIIESNGGVLLGCLVSGLLKGNVTQVTVKIANEDISGIIQTFMRYDYDIISGHEGDSYFETLKNRSEYLDKYLNM